MSFAHARAFLAGLVGGACEAVARPETGIHDLGRAFPPGMIACRFRKYCLRTADLAGSSVCSLLSLLSSREQFITHTNPCGQFPKDLSRHRTELLIANFKWLNPISGKKNSAKHGAT
jgi:hypothetical protein